jgi:hypothetical protein
LSFFYQSIHDGYLGSGSFTGRLDIGSKSYVGILTGYAHDDGENNCEITQFIAVVSEDSDPALSTALANKYVRVAKAASSTLSLSSSSSCSSAT